MASARLPATMRAAVMYDPDDIRIEERPLPRLEPGDVLVKTRASGVCSGDLMPWYVRKKAPFVFGHEPAGVVVAGERFVGDRVFAHHHAPCSQCEHCLAGRHVHCATWRATALDPGGMAEYFRVPSANLADTLVLPPALTFADGSLVEPLACVVKCLRRAFPREFERIDMRAPAARAGDPNGKPAALAGRTLYVIGAGVMGLLHVALAVAFGATVYASDFNEARREAAERLGARATFAPPDALERLREETGGRLADAVICGPGTAVALAAAVEATGADGTMLMFTPLDPAERFGFDQSRAYFRDVKLVSSYSCGPSDTRDALALLERGVGSASALRVEEFLFPEVERAYEAMRQATTIKAVITFP